MSAVFGLVNFDGRPVAEGDLDLMGEALKAHGPDGGGNWRAGPVGLGQRLMCFTPEDLLEKQPAFGAETLHVLVMDGRIDNRPELVRQWGIPSPEAREMPDSAFILRAYEKWGSECCRHLTGDYVFALYDRREGRVQISRSALSTRSLFYYSGKGALAFASAPKGLFALRWVPRELNHQSVADFLVRAPLEYGSSFFAGVNELPAGQTLMAGREEFRVQWHWRPDLRREIRFPRDSDYVEAFEELFERVVSDHVRSLTPVGAMMSGGLDSSLVAATAAGLAASKGQRVATFTEVPREGFTGELPDRAYADETPLVEAIGRRCGNLDLNFVRTEGAFMLDGIVPFFDAMEAPFRAEWYRIWWEAIMRRAGSGNVRVLLTGAPGNLTMSQSCGGLIAQLICQGRWGRALKAAQASAKRDGRSLAWAISRGALPMLPTAVWRPIARWREPDNPVFRSNPPWLAFSPIHPEYAIANRVAERAKARGQDFCPRPRLPNRADAWEALQRWVPGLQLTRGYEAEFGVQTRNPPGDIRVAEFCLAIPDEQHRLNGVDRSLIRRAMQDKLPDEVVNNRRRGLQAADWFEGANVWRSAIFKQLAEFGKNDLARYALDLKRVRKLLEDEPRLRQHSTVANLQSILGSALTVGSYFRWFESGSRGSEVAGGSRRIAASI